jgi:hypothetical protein
MRTDGADLPELRTEDFSEKVLQLIASDRDKSHSGWAVLVTFNHTFAGRRTKMMIADNIDRPEVSSIRCVAARFGDTNG